MSTDIKVPTLPESVTDATIVAWHKKPGEAVSRDDVLVDVETDKVVLEVPAPHDGVLESIVEDEGSVVVADQLLGTLKEGAAQASDSGDEESAEEPAAEGKGGATSPSVRKMLDEHGLSAADIKGSGSKGRITQADVQAHLDSQAAAPAAKPAAAKQAPAPAAPAPAAARIVPAVADGERAERRVPMTRLRAKIAERLLHATQSTAMLTTFNEVNMKPLIDLRGKYKDSFEKVHGVRLGFMSLFVKAAAEALKRFPEVNASIDGDDIVYHGYCDIGVAVSSDRGLVVPVLRDVEHMTMADIEGTIAAFGQKARDGKLSIEEMTGGTFTISNGGVFGSLLSTPILNPPQSAILGMHATQDRPVVENGEIVIRPMMYIAMSYDHRIVDGKGAVTFLKTIKELVEEPAKILLDI
ncbi:MAG: 2-oxoglutarate dehydrogenase complex dihydrolipoyllysine-residue succinyltransferase [Gammaproteobacteria bacterium]|nr:2-oxoglutarate dehydrogenase complex dihydrolipoyllysine-residue succinyltransferase [Gammaproteobacteria bacterium]